MIYQHILKLSGLYLWWYSYNLIWLVWIARLLGRSATPPVEDLRNRRDPCVRRFIVYYTQHLLCHHIVLNYIETTMNMYPAHQEPTNFQVFLPKTRSFLRFWNQHVSSLNKHALFWLGKQQRHSCSPTLCHDMSWSVHLDISNPVLRLGLDLSLTVSFMLILLRLSYCWPLLAVLTRKSPMLLDHVGQH